MRTLSPVSELHPVLLLIVAVGGRRKCRVLGVQSDIMGVERLPRGSLSRRTKVSPSDSVPVLRTACRTLVRVPLAVSEERCL